MPTVLLTVLNWQTDVYSEYIQTYHMLSNIILVADSLFTSTKNDSPPLRPCFFDSFDVFF